MLNNLRKKKYQIESHCHAKAILVKDFPEALRELEAALLDFRIPISEIIGSGGGEAGGTQRLRRALTNVGWIKSKFEIKKTINDVEKESISHEIDHVRKYVSNTSEYNIALEIEWNNKDPFFDRDLENFKRLHAEGAISVGVIITRGSSLQDSMKKLVHEFVESKHIMSFDDLDAYDVRPTRRQRNEVEKRVARGKSFQDAWTEHFVSDKFGAATTHWRKLQDRVDRGVGNPCPLLLIGLPVGIVVFDED